MTYELEKLLSKNLTISTQFQLFLCVLAFPPCKEFGENKENAVPLMPCRGECTYATTACVDVDFDEVMQSLSKWTDKLDCERFPEEYASPPLCWEITNGKYDHSITRFVRYNHN